MSELRTRIDGGARTKATGYVLVEVIASLVIFSIGMVAVMRAFSVATQARGLAQDYTVANLLCQKLLSEVRAMPQGTTGGAEQKGAFGLAYKRFRWEMTVVTEQPLTAEEQEKPQPQKPTGKRSRRAKKSKKEEEGAALKKKMELQEVTVTVSWKRRAASYDVSATALVPVEATETQDLKSGRERQQGSRGGLRDGVLDRGKRSIGIGALGNVGT